MSAVRRAAFAGRFYPGEARDCERFVDAALDAPRIARSIAGVVPHAGWVFSGKTAGKTVAGLGEFDPDTLVVFGAVHVRDWNRASLADFEAWETPLGPMKADVELAAALADAPDITVSPEAHLYEHSIEVELPFLQRAFPNARLLAVMVRPGPWAPGIGRAVRAAADDLGRKAIYLASTDLTHYGPSYGFEPAGRGPEGIRWAKEVNDRRFISAVAERDAQNALDEAERHHNACGAGAVAAMLGAIEGTSVEYVELEHTTSAENALSGPNPLDSVGYESAVLTEAGG